MSYYGCFSGKTKDIPRATLGKTGLRVGRLGIGTWELGVQKTSISDVSKILGSMLDAGGNLIDTSDNYNGAEQILGKALKSFRRDDFVIVTKCGDYTDITFDPKTGLSTNHPDYEYANLNFTPAVIKKNVEDSLRNLGVDVLDVLLIHTCYLDKLHQGDVIDAVIRAKKEGKVKHIGYSGDNAEIIYSAQIPEFSVLEMSLSVTDIRNSYVPLDVAKKAGMGIIIKRPVANAFWRKDLYLPAIVYGNEYRNRALKMKTKPSQFGLSNSNAGWMELALNFALNFPVDCLAVGTTRLDHMHQNIDIVSRFKRNSALIKEVNHQFLSAQSKIKKYSKDKVWLGLE